MIFPNEKSIERLQLIEGGHEFRLLDVGPNPILVIDEATKVRYVNEAFEKMTGYYAKDIIGIGSPYPWWPEDLNKRYARELSKDMRGRTTINEYQYKKKSGRDFWVEATTRSVIRRGGEKYFFMYLTDINEQTNMQSYIAERIKVQEEERQRMAIEIHDGLIQDLASLGLKIDVLCKNNNERMGEDFLAQVHELRDGIGDMADMLRSFSHKMHPSILSQGLVSVLEYLTQEISSQSDVDVQLNISGDEQQQPEETELHLYRIVQEAVRNIIKHAAATKAKITLRYTPNWIKLTIRDNGLGMELPEELGDFIHNRKLGVLGMQERARLLNGKFSLKSQVGKGTTVMVEAPVGK